MPKARFTTALSVQQLAQAPGLELRVIAGQSGVSRTMSWAHVSELPDPTPWLLGGELIMTTGIAIPRSAAAQRNYLQRLDDAGVAGLALSDGLKVPPLTRAFTKTADTRGFPVLRVPLSVPFISVARVVAAAVHDDTSAQMAAQMQVFSTLRDLALNEATPAQVFRRLERELGYQLFLCTPSGAPLLADVPAPPPHLAGMIPTSTRQAPTTIGGFALPVPSADGRPGYLLATPSSPGVAPNLAALQNVSIVAAFLLSARRQVEEVARRQGAETFAELLAGSLDAATGRRHIASLGLDPGARYRVWAVDSAQGTSGDAVTFVLQTNDIEHLILSQQAHHLLLCPDIVAVDTALETVSGVHAGGSRAFTLSPHLAVPRSEALWALQRAKETNRPTYHFDGETTDQWLTHDQVALSNLVVRCIGPAIDYDRAHRSDLVRTVRVWLDNNRSTSQAAQLLAIHPNTLSYRLQRFQQLTGKELFRTADTSEVWLALRAHNRGNGYTESHVTHPSR
ncbi:MAG: PucR family transcriptional regulator ligand-binding domain-containing protein [Terracoccus sp.]